MAKETRSQMLARLKRQRKKAGIGEFKKKSSSKRKSMKRTTRKTPKKARRRTYNMAKKKTTKRKSNGMNPMIKAVVGGFLYGIARQPIQEFTSGFMGGLSDEIGMLLVTGLGGMFLKGQLKNIAIVGASIEASRLAQNFSFGSLTSAKPTSNMRIIG
jgi:hypothetical protein